MEDRILIGSVDQGTSSSRFLVFDSKTAEVVTYHQVEIKQFYPEQGWCDEDPLEILDSVKLCIEKAVDNLTKLNINPKSIKAIGVTNQRETTVVWDKVTGKPLYNAIVWLDGRTTKTVSTLVQKTPTQTSTYWQSRCGLPITTYFSGSKLRWLLDNVPEVETAARLGRCMFGTVDSWLIWNLTGGLDNGVFATDVTNASRTMLMNIETLAWDDELIRFFEVEHVLLPEIRSSAEIYGKLADGPLKGLPISGVLGDQQAALVGQLCFSKGQAKNTYGTGCFLLYNTGSEIVQSNLGLLTTVAYKLGKDAPPVYALEGSVAIAGACIRWLRDNLGIISDSAESETLAATVDSTAGCYFVPAFTGLFCPHWQPDARGTICGLSTCTTKAHIVRAALEAVCYQTREILDAMNSDSGIPLASLQVDGGMTQNSLLMQMQADLVGIPVVRPSMPETTALGAAMAAGYCIGVWSLNPEDLSAITTDVFKPLISEEERDKRFRRWTDAVERSKHWDTLGEDTDAITNKQGMVSTCGVYAFTTMALAILAHSLS